eukprot:4152172-Prymnesium_polylepis.1
MAATTTDNTHRQQVAASGAHTSALDTSDRWLNSWLSSSTIWSRGRCGMSIRQGGKTQERWVCRGAAWAF